jgi:elongation factor Tu
MPQTKEHLSLAKAIGVKYIITYINKSDLADKEMLELVELEVRELLTSFGYDGDNAPIVHGSALQALEDTDTELGKNSIVKLMKIVDTYVPAPERDLKSPFFFPIEKTVAITGRGQVLVGTVTRGVLKKNDQLEIIGYGQSIKTVANDIQVFKTSVNECSAGQHVGILGRGIKSDQVRRGMVAVAPGSTKQTNYYEASVYMLKKEEGGRSKPIMNGYIQPLLTNTASIDCNFQLPKDREMLLGGDHINLNLLLKFSMPFQVGDKFTSKNQNIIHFLMEFK